MTKAAPLKDLASVIRSKNAGPYEITYDVIFTDSDAYERVRRSGALSRASVAALYRISEEDITYCDFFAPARAFKFTHIRRGDQGSVGERDTFGAQQHAPLLDVSIPGEDDN